MFFTVKITYISQESLTGWWWWHMPFIPALGRQGQVDLCEFEASLVYGVSSRTVRATQRNLSQKQTNKQEFLSHKG